MKATVVAKETTQTGKIVLTLYIADPGDDATSLSQIKEGSVIRARIVTEIGPGESPEQERARLRDLAKDL